MNPLLSCVALAALLVSPAIAQTEKSPQKVDRVHLKDGQTLEGRVVVDIPSYVEIDLGDGVVVGLDKSDVMLVEKIEGTIEAAASFAPARAANQDDWFLVHNAEGKAVGWLHEARRVQEDGRLRLSQEWHFRDGESRAEWSVVELWDENGLPMSAVFHERRRGPRGQSDRRADRTVRATLRGEKLVVERQSVEGGRRDIYDIEAGLSFPLGFRDSILRLGTEIQGQQSRQVFDPIKDRFDSWSLDLGRTRSVPQGKSSRRVRVLQLNSTERTSVEWLDGASSTVRRELNGPELVAIPSTERIARTAVKQSAVVGPVAFRAELGGSFGLWLPNPCWRFSAAEREGELTAASSDGAELTIARLSHIDDGVPAQQAADTVIRWLGQAYDDLRVNERNPIKVRGRPGYEVRCEIRQPTRGNPGIRQLWVRVFEQDGAWYGAAVQLPADRATLVERDLAWMLERIELDPRGLSGAAEATPVEASASRTGR